MQNGKVPDLHELARAAFDGAEHPLIVCDSHLRVVLRNHSARGFAQRTEVVWTDEGVIQRKSKKHGAFRSAVAATLETGRVRVIELCGADNGTSVRCRISRLRAHGAATYALLEFDTTHAQLEPAFVAFDALTAAERHVAELLIRGATVRDICRLRGTSLNTVKTQVRHVLQKTHTSSQVELMALFAVRTTARRDDHSGEPLTENR